jgi:hypothetical protein
MSRRAGPSSDAPGTELKIAAASDVKTACASWRFKKIARPRDLSRAARRGCALMSKRRSICSDGAHRDGACFFLSITERFSRGRCSQIRCAIFFARKTRQFLGQFVRRANASGRFLSSDYCPMRRRSHTPDFGFRSASAVGDWRQSLPLLRAREKEPQECGTYSFVFWGP